VTAPTSCCTSPQASKRPVCCAVRAAHSRYKQQLLFAEWERVHMPTMWALCGRGCDCPQNLCMHDAAAGMHNSMCILHSRLLVRALGMEASCIWGI
jgi:hypothetical protein